MKVSDNFSRSEFACKGKECLCGFASVDVELLKVLEDVRAHFKEKNPDAYVKINSGNRCAKHNKQIGGAPGSYHVKGMAADIVVNGIPATDVYHYLAFKYPDKYGIGRYKRWTHIDVREGPARW